MLSYLSLLNPTTVKAAIAVAIIAIIAGGGYYLGHKVSKVEAKQYEILALECEKRSREREIEITQQALEAEKKRLEYERELTARIEAEIAKNGKLSQQLEEEIKKSKTVTREVIKYVTQEIQKTIYRECVIPPSGVSVLNQAARDYNATRNSPGTNSN